MAYCFWQDSEVCLYYPMRHRERICECHMTYQHQLHCFTANDNITNELLYCR